MKPLYGFLQDEKWYEDLGHIALGFFAPFYWWWREHATWPPGEIWRLYWRPNGEWTTKPTVVGTHQPKEVVPVDRVADSYRDFLGYAIGDVLRTAVLIGWHLAR